MSTEDASGWSGHDSDVLDSLANERNGLAWQRTALSWFAAGAAVARYFAGDGLLNKRSAIGWLMVALGALIWYEGIRHYHHNAASIRADVPTRMPVRTMQVVWLTTSSAIAVIVAIEIAGF